jgi:hypothetical protein
MSRNRRVFTPIALETIRGLAHEGKSASEIASAIGSTPGSVRVKCCELKIKLQSSRAGLMETQHYPDAKRALFVRMRPDVYAALQRKANEMDKSAGEFAGMLLEAIVVSDIYGAVLDEGQ